MPSARPCARAPLLAAGGALWQSSAYSHLCWAQARRARLAPRSPRPAAHACGGWRRRAMADAWVGPVCHLVCAASFIADATVQRASRRLCNLAYSLWVVAQARRRPSPAARPRAQRLCLLATESLGAVHLPRNEPRLSGSGPRPLGRVESPPAGRLPSCQLAHRRGQPDAAYHAREWPLWAVRAVRVHGGGLCRRLRG